MKQNASTYLDAKNTQDVWKGGYVAGNEGLMSHAINSWNPDGDQIGKILRGARSYYRQFKNS